MEKNWRTSKIPLTVFGLSILLVSCSKEITQIKEFEKKAKLMNNYEKVALFLSKENRELKTEIKRLEFEIEKLKQEKTHLEMKVGGEAHDSHTTGHESAAPEEKHASHAHEDEKAGRSIASVHAAPNIVGKDLVEFKTYHWNADDMAKMADAAFEKKQYEKAAQFYQAIFTYYPKYKAINDQFYFKAGVAAYESGAHHDWTVDAFTALMEKYPRSEFYRGAKLWVALTYFKQGEKQKFYSTVEEFRKKYRNTKEWKVLSQYYEKIEATTHE